jgi:hypothetical protein
MTPQPTTTTGTEEAAYVFSDRELARLAVYRAAVLARFYTDAVEPIALVQRHRRPPKQPRAA